MKMSPVKISVAICILSFGLVFDVVAAPVESVKDDGDQVIQESVTSYLPQNNKDDDLKVYKSNDERFNEYFDNKFVFEFDQDFGFYNMQGEIMITINQSNTYYYDMKMNESNEYDETVENENDSEDREQILFFLRLLFQKYKYIISAIGIAGNLLICVVIMRYKDMQSPPNVYIFSFAIADIAILTVQWIDYAVGIRRTQNEWYQIIKLNVVPVISWTVKSVTAWTVVAMTVDRYMALCHPFLARSYSTKSKAIKVSIIIWIICFFFSWDEISRSKNDNQEEQSLIFPIDIPSIITFFVIPLCIIIVLYIFIIRSMWKSSKLMKTCNIKGKSYTGRSLKISVAIVIQFIICWGPSYVTLFMFKHFFGDVDRYYFQLFNTFAKVMSTVGQIIDPLVHIIVSKRFRTAFKELLSLDCIRDILP